ncbi:FEKKY domain-containing protein [Bizionia arctica]|uniref:Uncharacterized protein n=1 Tax=Bizionia arctica TaxID=1495645 RepID=A0A917GLC2_9FLAO|nr:hypothetical protein [Bizionia arctica]GGG50643.1 hypothetical protein GCM10010976_22330 [Bizionia arctica]
MNKKTILFSGVTMILLVIGLWYFGFFNRFNYLTAKNDIAKNTPQKIWIGELIISPRDMNKISAKYGFENIGFGCVVSTTELNGIEIYNAQIEKYLTKINGTAWKSNYIKELDSLTKLKQQEWKDKFN